MASGRGRNPAGDAQPRKSPAEEALLEFLQLQRERRAPSFESFCAGRPEVAADLARLMAAWSDMQSIFEGADPGALLQRLVGEAPGGEAGGSPGDGSPADRAPRPPRRVPPSASLSIAPAPRRGDGTAAGSDLLADLPTILDRYAEEGLVDAGGMGLVHRAFDANLRRHVALKVLRPAEEWANAPPGPRREAEEAVVTGRFLDEALITAQLDHPGIVPVHQLGLDAQGRPFFAMKLVKGETLREVLEHVAAGREGWTVNRSIGVLLRVCEAVAYAHSKGVIHRDIKPANVMVGRFGQTFLMDWGLARVLRGSREGAGEAAAPAVRPEAPAPISPARAVRAPRVRPSGPDSAADSWLFTQDGGVVGTPVYMSPEQATGDVARVDERTDIYSLGAILWHLLTGRMPYVEPGDQPIAFLVLMRVREGGLPSPAEFAPDAPPTLVAICDRAMARDPRDRYASAADMAAALEDYLEDISEAREEARRQARRAQRLNDFLIGMLSAHDPAEARGREVTVREVRERAAARVGEELAGQPLDEAAVRSTLGNLFLATGRLAEAESQLAAAVELLVRLRGPDDREALRTRADLAAVVRRLGRGAEGVALIRDVLARQRRLLGDRDADTLRTIVLLAASVYRVTLDTEEAERLYREALEGRRAVLGEDHPETLVAMGSLGALLLSTGRWAEALELQQLVHAGLARRSGADHPDTLVALGELAHALQAGGRLAQAEQAFREVVAGQERVLGPDHPHALVMRNNLGMVLLEAGRPGEAEPILRQAARRYAEVVDAAHPSAFNLRQGHALALLALGRPAEAEAGLAALVADAARALGDDHLLVARFRHNRARALVALRRVAEARASLAAAGATYAQRLQPGHAWRRQLAEDAGALPAEGG